jgi:hypothetical protein
VTNIKKLGHTLLVEALETAAANSTDQNIGEWLRDEAAITANSVKAAPGT